jgi:DNA end-binding protein Ku
LPAFIGPGTGPNSQSLILRAQCAPPRGGRSRQGGTGDRRRTQKALRYPYEVRKEQDYFDDIPDEKVPKDMLELATHIVETKAGHFNPERFDDRYEDALKELLKKKQSGQKIERPTEHAPAKVINLMDALRRSVQAERGAAPSKKGKKRVEGQKEMLLPIEGKRASRETAKKPAKSGARQRKAG